MGVTVDLWNVRYVSLIDAIYCNVHSIDPSYMCIDSEKNRLRIDDFRKIKKIACFLITYKIVKMSKWPWHLTFIWHWPWVLPLTLTIWRNIFFSFFFHYFKSRDAKMWRRMSKGRLPVPKLWLKRWCSWFLMCLTLTLTFQGDLIWVNSPFVPLHDWCKFWSDIFINSGDIAHWNMEKLPILYNGNFRCHGNVCYVFPINPFFCKLHRIGPSNMCVHFEKNRLNIDDFRRFHKSTISHR